MRSREAFIRNIYNIPGCYICTRDEEYLRHSHMAAFVQLTGNGHYSSNNRRYVSAVSLR